MPKAQRHQFCLLTSTIEDGTCIIEPLIAPGFASARASDQDLAYGAGTVIHDCVAKIPSQGGIAKDFSKYCKSALLDANRFSRIVKLMDDQTLTTALVYSSPSKRQTYAATEMCVLWQLSILATPSWITCQ